MKKIKIYLGGPLFSIGEKQFNLNLASSLAKKVPGTSFILPQKYAKKIAKERDFAKKMFTYCIEAIDKADLVLCLLDGPDVDSGAALEIGYAFARRKPIIGMRSDFRNSEIRGVNLMILGACTEFYWLRNYEKANKEYIQIIAGAIRRIIRGVK
jgi:nucleoside 2-deoxyribosyltransferase